MTQKLMHIEKQIIGLVVDAFLAQGFTLGVNDGVETTVHRSNDRAEILGAMRTTGEDYLHVDRNVDAADPDASRGGWVRFVYGNGTDVLTDYTTNLDAVLKPINAEIDRFDRQYR